MNDPLQQTRPRPYRSRTSLRHAPVLPQTLLVGKKLLPGNVGRKGILNQHLDRRERNMLAYTLTALGLGIQACHRPALTVAVGTRIDRIMQNRVCMAHRQWPPFHTTVPRAAEIPGREEQSIGVIAARETAGRTHLVEA